jgi:hypothetical protein
VVAKPLGARESTAYYWVKRRREPLDSDDFDLGTLMSCAASA